MMTKEERQKIVEILQFDIIIRCNELLSMVANYPDIPGDEVISIDPGAEYPHYLYAEPDSKVIRFRTRTKNFRYQRIGCEDVVIWCENLPEMQAILIRILKKWPRQLRELQRQAQRNKRKRQQLAVNEERDLNRAVNRCLGMGSKTHRHRPSMNDFLIPVEGND